MLRRLLTILSALAITMTLAVPAEARPASLRGLIEDVAGATAKRYDARDSAGHVMDTVKIIQDGSGYLAVYHFLVPSEGRFHAAVATSTDLLNWTFAHDFGAGTHQPTIHATGSGYVMAWEQDPDNHLAFRYFPDRASLLSGTAAKTFDAPQVLSDCAEGTPNIYSVSADLSVIDVGAHYFWNCDRDRQQRGTLRDFSSWTASPQPQLDAPLLAAGVAGNIGDRDDFTYRDRDYLLMEGQFTKGDFGTWRPFLFDVRRGTAEQLAIRTDGGSTAFANPTLTLLRAPDGRRAAVMTMFLPSEGAAAGESGSLIYYTTL